jgi:hypothetical protein
MRPQVTTFGRIQFTDFVGAFLGMRISDNEMHQPVDLFVPEMVLLVRFGGEYIIIYLASCEFHGWIATQRVIWHRPLLQKKHAVAARNIDPIHVTGESRLATSAEPRRLSK